MHVTMEIMKKHKQLLWSLIAFALAIASIAIVLAQSRELSFDNLWHMVKDGDPFWTVLAIICMLGYIWFEGTALWYLLQSIGYKKSRMDAVTYAAADIYCSAITPSASGGQPVCAWFMKKDGIPMGAITAVLAMYLVTHTFALLTMGLGAIVLWPRVFADFYWFAKLLIVCGYLSVIGLACLFVALLSKEGWVYKQGCRIIDWLHKKRIVKRAQHWKDRLKHSLDDYSACIGILRGRGRLVFWVYLLNVLQRLCQTIISMIVYMANGGAAENAGTVFAVQCFTTMGSVCVPIPGGMGAADYLLYDGLHNLMDKEAALQLELLSRSFSFYLCVIVSLALVVVGYLRRKNVYFTLHRNR